jgi:NHLM bacteriocin system ABC transporter peptidase/ATP-binding protein
MEAVECGAAALGIVLAYYGRYVPLEELRVRCGVSRDGSKASNVLKAARHYGLSAKGFSKEPDDLKTLPLPLIVFWNFNHFLVVEGFGKDRVFLNDPALGPRQVSIKEFDESFTGVVMLFEKTADFTPGDARPSLLKAFIDRLSGSGDAITFLFIASLIAMITGLIIPAFSRVFVDNILIGGMDGWLKPLLIGMGLTAVVRGAATWLQQHFLMRFEIKLSVGSSCAFIRHILKLPMDFFFQRYSGEISSRIAINDHVAQQLAGAVSTNILNLFLILFYLLLMFQYDLTMTLTGLAVAAVNVLLLHFVSRKRADSSMMLLQERGKLYGNAMSGLQLMENLKATGSEDDFFAKWSGQFSKVLNGEQQLTVSSLTLDTLSPLLTAFNTVAILGMGGFRIMDGYMTIGMLVAYQSLMASFMGPVNQLISLGASFQELKGDMNRLDDVLRYPPDRLLENDDGTTGLDARQAIGPKLSGDVELVNITFGYSRLQPPLIEDFCLKLRPGMRVALVGGSGSGKSTIAKIICGLFEPWSGEILFDGMPRAELPRNVVCNSLSVVDQDLYLFKGSIKDNLTLWDETIHENHLIAAAKDACIHNVIASRPGGYDAEVGEAGKNFSGGQLQRLEIARALAINPSILVMDEATSALDAATEMLVENNIQRRGCTCIVVAHRLSAIRDCDEIIVLDAGQVIERGTHQELIVAEGHYANLVATM